MQSSHLQELEFISVLPLSWEMKPRLLETVETRRPRSLEMVKYPRNDSKTLPTISRGDGAEKHFALVVHRLKKSRRLHKRKKSKNKNSFHDVIVRPQTWGPNGVKWTEFWDLLDKTLRSDKDCEVFDCKPELNNNVNTDCKHSVGDDTSTCISTNSDDSVTITETIFTGAENSDAVEESDDTNLPITEQHCDATRPTLLTGVDVGGCADEIAQIVVHLLRDVVDAVASNENRGAVENCQLSTEEVSHENVLPHSGQAHDDDGGIILAPKEPETCDDEKITVEQTVSDVLQQIVGIVANNTELVVSNVENVNTQEDIFIGTCVAEKEGEFYAESNNVGLHDDLKIAFVGINLQTNNFKAAEEDDTTVSSETCYKTNDTDLVLNTDPVFNSQSTEKETSKMLENRELSPLQASDTQTEANTLPMTMEEAQKTADIIVTHQDTEAQPLLRSPETAECPNVSVLKPDQQNNALQSCFDPTDCDVTEDDSDASITKPAPVTQQYSSNADECSRADVTVKSESCTIIANENYLISCTPDEERVQDIKINDSLTASKDSDFNTEEKTEQDIGILQSNLGVCETNLEIEDCSADDETVTYMKSEKLERPTSLFYSNWSQSTGELTKLAFLKAYSTEALTPTVESSDADVFSEETELALEGATPFQRQDSFINRSRPVVTKRRKDSIENEDAGVDVEDTTLDNFQGTPTNSFAIPGEQVDPSWLKCRSLPTRLEPDFSGYDQRELEEPDSEDFSSVDGSYDDLADQIIMKSTNRDSTISRESAASSGTVVASDEDNLDDMDVKSTASADPILNSSYLAPPLPPKAQMVRSKSLDPHRGPNSVLLAPEVGLSSSQLSPLGGGNMRSPVGVAISAPTITIATDHCGEYGSNSDIYRLNDGRFLAPDHNLSTSSILCKNAFYLADDFDVSSSRSSSVPSSPTNSPQLQHNNKTKYKGLRDKETKVAERQALEACKWLRAAGFPQYAHLYEVGRFPVDITSVSADHDFLANEHMQLAALVRRLNVLNKCANMKLDKPLVKDAQTDDDDVEDEEEECAISEYWKLEEDGRRWSRLDSKGAEVNRNPSNASSKLLPHLDESQEDAGDVFAPEERLSSAGSDDPSPPDQQRPIIDGALKHSGIKVGKSKSNSFLRRVDLRKFRPGSFRRHQRTGSADVDPRTASKARPLGDVKSKSIRKGGKTIVISEPVLKSGHEKIDNMRCLPIEQSTANGISNLQNQHRGRKNSSQSLISSSSSSGSGAASTASTPASRLRSFTEDFSSKSDSGEIESSTGRRFTRPHLETSSSKSRAQTLPDPESTIFMMPKDHIPGKFPSAIRELGSDGEAAPLSGGSESDSNSGRTQRPVSIYDNLPESALSGAASAQDLMNILDPTARSVDDSGVFVVGSQESLDVGAPAPTDAAFWSVDDIVERTHTLQQMVRSWEDEEDNKSDHQEAVVLPSYSSENISSAEDETIAASRGADSDHKLRLRQARLRWQSFNRDHGPGSQSQQTLQLHNLSVGQLMILRRLSMLKLTALLESYAFNTSKGSLSWSVPRFIRRIKVPDYKDKAVFSVPLLQNVKRFGQPLPQCIQHALAFLRRTALDQVGLFRKPGVRSRIQKLRANCENNPLLANFEECSAYDVADMVKQFFRELPDPLMTMKMSETFIGIFLYVPKELWLQTLQAAVMLLPDETRETLKTLLCFLSDVSSRSAENHMNETNLATCFAPSLFYQQFGSIKSASSSSPKVRKQQAGKGATGLALGRPDMKEMNENVAANNCLAFMIRHVKELFKISEDAMTQCRMSVMQQSEDVLADEIGYTPDMGDESDYYADFHAYVDRITSQTIREEQRVSQNKGGWQSVPSAPGSELMYKKMNDDNPLRMWRCQVEIEGADVRQVTDRVLNERHLWDDDLVQWKVVQQPDERTQMFQTVRAEMSPHPTRDYCVLRSWRTNANSRGASVIVEASTSQPNLLGDVRGVVLTSRYVIEPTDNPSKCLLTHVSRVDTKGRNPEWYNKTFGHIDCQLLLRLRDSIRVMPPKVAST